MSDKVKCLYCFKEFDPYTEIHFRAQGPIKKLNKSKIAERPKTLGITTEIKRDEIEIIDEAPSKKLDEKLFEYYAYNLGYDDESAEASSKQYPFFKPEDYLNMPGISVVKKVVNEKEYYERLTFDKEYFKTSDYDTDTRLCPHCHNILPDRFGIRKSLSISMVGYTNAGKTVFLTSLIHALQHNRNIRATLIPVGQENDYTDTIDTYMDEIFVKRVLPDATRSKQPPLVYVYTYKYKVKNKKNEIEELQNSINLIFYDIEGEACRVVEKLKKEGNNIRHSDGIIYLLDPVRLEHIAHELLIIDKTNNLGIFERDSNGIINPDLVKNNPFEVIHALFKYMLNEAGEKKSEIPAAFVLTKTDIFDVECVKQNIDFLYKDPSNRILPSSGSEDKHKGYLDVLDIRNLNKDVINFLDYFNHSEYKDAAELHFENYSFFAVSALNQIPSLNLNKTAKSSTLEKDVSPYRILDPFLWIMNKNSLLSAQQVFENGEQINISDSDSKNSEHILSKVFKLFKR